MLIVCVEYFCCSFRFEISLVHVAVSKIHPSNNFYKINHRESLIVNCFVNSSAFSTFYVTFIKIINVDTNNKCVYLKFMVNVVNLFFTFMLSLLTLSTSAFDKSASGLFFCSSL